MWAFVLRRLAVLAFTLLVVSLLAFLLPYLSGGDPARTIMRARVAELAVDTAEVDAIRQQLGLDRALPLQYLSWLSDAARGDLGYSFTSRQKVGAEIGRGLLVSLTLALTALAAALAVAIPLGTLAALRPGKIVDSIATFLTQSFVAIPEYWLAPMAILVFALHLGWLPSAGWLGPSSVVLPALALAPRPLAYFTRVTRAAMIDVLQAPYITAARSRGLSMRQTVLRHGLRNSSLPVLTLFALWLAGLLGGSVVIEVIFSIPGMGRLIYQAVVNSDIPMLQGGLVCIVAISVIINTVVDIIYGLVNPTVRVTHVN
ncbi:MAG: ABC transporter permease [Proteobacteria bacterium]|nr:ABC transporter permease [Pseudomonadota bacterium]